MVFTSYERQGQKKAIKTLATAVWGIDITAARTRALSACVRMD